jgi:uncharacterized protein YhbP (UPF0306 family)
MTREELGSIVIQFMDGLTTMTLACSLNDEPWTSPVYYARQGFDLIFFSSELSRHSSTFRENPKAAASIYGDYAGWKEIKGLQMNGTVHALTSPLALAKATATYLKRHPFVRDLLGGSTGSGSGMATKMSRVALYVFRPGDIYYLDNSLGFGVRWKLEIREGVSVASPVRVSE